MNRFAKRRCIWLLFLLNISVFTVRVLADEDYATWDDSQVVSLNTKASGANVSNNVLKFPVLIRLNPGNFGYFSQTLAGGADVRFSKTDGTHLSYEIERWVDNESDNDTAEIWVKIDTVYGNDSIQSFLMYWKKIGAADSSSSEAVFDTANGFSAVWHLEENGSTTAGAYKDATVNNNDGTGANLTASSDVSGIVGICQNFDSSSSNSISVAYAATLNLNTWTVSAWTQLESVGNHRGIIGTRFGSGTLRPFDMKWMPDRLHGNIGDGTNWLTNVANYSYTPSAGAWYHVAYVVTTNSYKIYLNGTEVVGNGSFSGTPLFMSSNETLRIGRSSDYANEFMDGKIDEVRLSKTSRSDDWIKLCYQNQQSSQTLLTQHGSGAPTDIQLSNATIAENMLAQTVICTITVIDANDPGPHNLTLSGTDAGSFSISGNQLVTAVQFDYENKNSYSVIVRATNKNNMSYSETFTINVTNVNDPPSGLTLTNTTIAENSPIGSLVCTLKTIDEDTGDSHTYSLATGGADNPSFYIDGNLLRIGVSPDYEVKRYYFILLQTSDGTASYQKNCTLYVADINDIPTDIVLSSNTVLENRPIGTFVGKFYAIDQDVPATPTSFAFDAGAGSTDNSVFAIQTGTDSLRTNTVFNYTTKSTYEIRVKGTDIDGNSISKAFTINIGALPMITFQPVNTTVIENQSTSISVTATGPGSITYSWRRTDNELVQGTTSELVLPNIPIELDNKAFYCIVTNSFGNTTSSICTLKVVSLPIITSHPRDTGGFENDTVSFSVTASGKNLTYVWMKNRDTLSSKTSTQTITGLTYADNGDTVVCIVTNEAGSVRSNSAKISVLSAPLIITEPVNSTVSDGDSAHFLLVASGASPLAYFWYKNNILFDSSLSPALTIRSVSMADSNTQYYCVVKNDFGEDTTITVTLAVIRSAPVIVLRPMTISISETDSGFFSIRAIGTPPLSYSWYRKGIVDPAILDDTLWIKNPNKTADSGAAFFCIVSNNQGSVCSDTVRLLVGTVAPRFDKNPPKQLIVYVNSPLDITVSAIGSKPLAFTWRKVGRNTTVDSSVTLHIDSVSKADSGSYYCIAKNSAGSRVSDTMKLSVADIPKAPVITAQPQSAEIYVSDNATFRISATGNPKPLFQWLLNGAPRAGATDSVLVLKGITDSSTTITCQVSNHLDTIVSDPPAILKIQFKPKALFSANVTAIPESTTVTFTNSSIGPVTSWLWNFGDNSTSTLKNPTHTYLKTGLYTVSLKVTDSLLSSDSISVKNCISVYQRGSNPLRLAAHYLSGRNVRTILSRLSEIDTSLPVPYADSIGIWTKAKQLPTGQNDFLLRTYSKSRMALSKDTLIDTVTIPGTDSLVGFMSRVFYNNNQISPFGALNGTLLLLKDTITPPNPFIIQAKYLGGDSVRFTALAPNNYILDTARIDSIYFSFSTDSSQLSSTVPNKNSFSIMPLIKKSATNRFDTLLHNIAFKSADTTFYYRLTVKGKNKKVNQTAIAKFSTSIGGNINPIVLEGNAINSSVVQLYWRKITDPSITKIRIFYSVNELSAGMVFASFPVDTIVIPNGVDTTAIVTNLIGNKKYYFAAQVSKKTGENSYKWSAVTDKSLLTLKTPDPNPADTITNTIDILSLTFDSMTASLKVSWCLANNKAESLNVLITYSTERFPDLLVNPRPITTTKKCEIDIPIDLKGPILFDTTYFVALWLRKPNGPLAAPVDSSRKSIKIPSFLHQPVVLFNEGVDTVYANNNRIIFWKDASFPSATPFPINITSINTANFPGMIFAGKGFKFGNDFNLPEFFVGITYELPARYTDRDVLLYRIDANGLLSLEHSCKINTLKKTVSVKTKNFSHGFIPLIDTLAPVLTITSDTADAIDPNLTVIDKIKVKDNIKNVRLTHTYSRGDQFTAITMDTLFSKVDGQMDLKIPNDMVTTLAGVRSSIKISDGRSVIETNTSRRVRRSSSDEGVTEVLQWRPVFVTADLKVKYPDSLLKRFSKTDSVKYDNRYLCLYRWYPFEQNKSSPEKWVEYSSSTRELFSLTPGKLFWVKTKETKSFGFGEGITTSLKDSFPITFTAQEWTDFALPFKFSSSIKEIAASNPSASRLQYYYWTKNDKGRYITKELFAPGLPISGNILNKDAVFSVYNPTLANITVKIPPYPVNPVNESALTKQLAPSEWWVKINTRIRDSETIPSLYCGYSPASTTSWYPIAPSFSLAKMSVFKREENKHFGHFIEKKETNGIAQEIAFHNDADTIETFSFEIENVGSFPKHYKSIIVNTTTGEIQTSGSVTVAPNSVEYRWLVAGTDFFREGFLHKAVAHRYMLHTLYPNPAKSMVNIRFSVPFSSKEKLVFTIYDALGRRVWQKALTEPLAGGNHSIFWNGRNQHRMSVQAGMYVVVLSVLNEKGSKIHRFETRLTYIP